MNPKLNLVMSERFAELVHTEITDEDFLEEMYTCLIVNTKILNPSESKEYYLEHIRAYKKEYQEGNQGWLVNMGTVLSNLMDGFGELERRTNYLDKRDMKLKIKGLEDKMETVMKFIEENETQLIYLSQEEKIASLTKENTHVQEKLYDCQAEVLQQMEFALTLQKEKERRNGRVSELIQEIDTELGWLDLQLKSLESGLVYPLLRIEDRKVELSKQRKIYEELLSP